MSGLPYRGLDSNMRVPAKVFLIALLLVVSIVLAAQSEKAWEKIVTPLSEPGGQRERKCRRWRSGPGRAGGGR